METRKKFLKAENEEEVNHTDDKELLFIVIYMCIASMFYAVPPSKIERCSARRNSRMHFLRDL